MAYAESSIMVDTFKVCKNILNIVFFLEDSILFGYLLILNSVCFSSLE